MKPNRPSIMDSVPKQENTEVSQLDLPVVDLGMKIEKSVIDYPNQTKLILSPVISGIF